MPVQIGELTSEVQVRGQPEGAGSGDAGGGAGQAIWDQTERHRLLEEDLRRARERVAAGGFGG
jgi:hypothetical protein